MMMDVVRRVVSAMTWACLTMSGVNNVFQVLDNALKDSHIIFCYLLNASAYVEIVVYVGV